MIFLLAICFILYALLSWVLLFRDIRALLIIHNFYPQLGDTLLHYRDLLTLHGLNSWPTAVFMLLTLVSFAAYFLLIRQKLSVKKVLIVSVVFQIILFFSYPILSTDIFYYILSDRLAVVYHKNVWTTSTSTIPNDPFYHLTDWRGQTKIYGPVNQFFYNFSAIAGGNNLIAQVATHKILSILFVLATFFVVYRLLRRFYPDNLPAKLLLIFGNPLFVLETAGSGHNDILMIFFTSAALFFYLAKKEKLTALFLALGVQVKLVPILLAIFFIADFIRQRQIKKLLNFSITFLIVNLILFMSMGINPASFISRTFYSTDLYWQSFPTLLRSYLPQAEVIVSPLLIVFVSVQLMRTLVFKANPVRTFAETLFVYFLLFLKTYWNWYALWTLVMVPFFPWGRLSRAIVLFSLTSLLAYPILWASQRFNYRDPVWSVIIYLVLSAIPAVFYLYGRLVQKIPA